jgi:hypothetical protein
MKASHLKIYISTFIATILIFVTAFSVSGYLNNKKTAELKSIEDRIAIDILSFETEFDSLTKESSCAELDRTSIRSDLNSLSSKLIFMEGQLGKDNSEVSRLRRSFSVLQIRDFLLAQRLKDKCSLGNVFILYFYAHNNACAECQQQEYILRALKDEYPQIDVYSFDYDLDLSAVETLLDIHNIPNNLPIIYINGKSYAAFSTLHDIEAVLAPLITPISTTTKTHTQ